jgi:hypothetical protein
MNTQGIMRGDGRHLVGVEKSTKTGETDQGVTPMLLVGHITALYTLL